MIFVEMLLCLLALATLVPVSVLTIQVLMALPALRPRAMLVGRRPTVAIVIPAHNESLSIASTLRSIIPQTVAGDRVLVVADNCSDDTARVAEAAGAEVLERTDPDRRGKGYALDAGIRHIQDGPPEVVLILDADCQIDDGGVAHLARLCLEKDQPVQGLDLMHSPRGGGLGLRIAEFAWLVKNHVRPLGFHRLNLPCHLMGTGMAFPWRIIANAPLASGHIVEDLKLGIDLACAGKPALFCPEARITSYFPSAAAGIKSQRTRWEHGHLGVILSDAPRLFLEAMRRRDAKLLALAFDLTVPPLALLALVVSAAFVGAAALFAITGTELPIVLASMSTVLLSASVSIAWVRYGRQAVSFAGLCYSPIYALRKMPLYIGFIVRRQVGWVRSQRDK